MVVIDSGTVRRFKLLEKHLDERLRRCVAAAEAAALGPRGISIVSRATGVSRRAIRRGLMELREAAGPSPRGRIRRPGGGRKRARAKDPTLGRDLEQLVEPTARGDPESPLRWTCKSVRQLAAELQRQGHQASHQLVSELLHELGYSLQANRKTLEGTSHPDRNAQFEYINRQVRAFLRTGDPVISVDTKKKELVGHFKNGGQRWLPQGTPDEVSVYDFPSQAEGKAIPYGAYDIARNRAVVNVGVTHETAEFAVESIRRWWRMDGRRHYREAQRLLICADSGGGNGSRQRAWKLHLQELSDETGMAVTVCHYPPGTSKWNKIEHRLFS